VSVTGNLERYRIVSSLGSGGMATVALAQDTLLDRPVALKRMTGGADARGLSRLRREALLGASVSHRNLVSIYDVVTAEDGDLVIVMEYVNGETLRDALTRQGKLPTAEALRILEGVAAGLDTIHRRGIVHRDVKPSNVLLGTDGAVKLADLGIASVPDRTRITTAGSVLGSLSYMAPEQLDDTPSTPAIDVYALAAVTFQVLSGRKARREANPVALAHAISTQPPPDLRDAWPQAPRAAAELLIAGMSRDPRVRPRSAGELIERLRAALVPEDTAPIAIPALPAVAPVNEPRPADVSSISEDASPAGSPAPPLATISEPSAASARTRVGPPSRATAKPSAQPRPARSRIRLFAAALLALVTGAVVLAVLLNTGGSQPRARSTALASHHSPARTLGSAPASLRSRPAGTATNSTAATSTSAGNAPASGGKASTSAGNAPASAGNAPASAGNAPASAGNAPASGGNAATPAAGSGGASTSAATPSPVSASTSPVAAVESFYELAAAHRYSDAWALAEPSFQSQLGGYQLFQTGQAGDRSISFDAAQVVSQSSSGATVAVRTTSVRTDGTHQCAGTVDLRPDGSSSTWRLSLIHITCTS